MNLLEKYGLTPRFINEASMYEGLRLARVIAQYRGLYKIVMEEEEALAELSGKMRHEIEELAKFPAVGDYVMVTKEEGQEKAIIHNVLSRKSVFMRNAVGAANQAQVVAANVDTVFICMSLNNNYNLSRLERYLSIAWDSGATPVIVLTKADLCNDVEATVMEVERVSSFSDVITTSIYDDKVEEKIIKYLKCGETVAFIGSSGVGKSTLINKIIGTNSLDTKEVGIGDKGKHTTTGRKLFPSSFGGVLMDTPGMREIGVESADLSMSFAEIEDIAEKCKFKDCSHKGELGCAIQEALGEGLIDERRLENYFKLKKESGYEGLNSREIENKKMERMFKEVGGIKNAKKFLKKKF